MSSALLPIGQLSEEAQEAQNKDFKRYIIPESVVDPKEMKIFSTYF